MAFSLFKKKDPICGMKEEQGKGQHYDNKWFCSNNCLQEYKKTKTTAHHEHSHGGCCHH